MADPLVWKQAYATIDDRTTMICLHAAGQIQPVGEPFDTLAGKFPHPPFHLHCRTLVIPYMRGFINTQRETSNDELQRRPRRQRDPRNYRETVPPPATADIPAPDLLDGSRSRSAGVPLPGERDRPDRTPLDADGKAAVRDWRAGGATRVNDALHGRADWTPETLDLAYGMEAAMETLGEPISGYRTVTGVDSGDWQVGNVVVDSGFTTITTDPDALPGAESGMAVLALAVPAGAVGLVVGGAASEVVLAYGTGILITAVTVTAAGVLLVSAEVQQP